MAIYSFTKKKIKPERKYINYISYGSILFGLLFLFWSFYPIIFFEIYSYIYIRPKISTPIPQDQLLKRNLVNVEDLGAESIFSTNLADFTKAGLWFPNIKQEKNKEIKISEYTISIPRLNIVGAKVIVGGEDLNMGLIHYAPKSLPGQNGNVAIFGHSILPQLAKPGLDYKSIFTYLPSMEKGDKIQANIEGAIYDYQVVDLFVVKPEQVSVLSGSDDDSYLTLFTCVPPGTYRLRLGVKARLVR